MAIRVGADDRFNGGGERREDVHLPGARKGDDDEVYDFVYPRTAVLIRATRRIRGMDAITGGIEELAASLKWLAEGFGPEAWAHIEERMADDDDLLDEEHMLVLVRLLNEDQTARPITSSNGVSRQPWRKSATAAPSPQESDSVN